VTIHRRERDPPSLGFLFRRHRLTRLVRRWQFKEPTIIRIRKATLVLTCTVALVTGVAACGALKQLTTGEKVSTAFDKLGDSDSLSVSFSLDATAAQLVALDQGTSDAMKMVDAKNVAGLGATVTLSADKPLNQVLPAAQSGSGTLPPSLAMDIEVHAGGGKSLFEVRAVNNVEYLKIDLDNLVSLSGDANVNQEIASVQSELDQIPPQYAPLKDLVQGKWVSIDVKQLTQIEKSADGASGSGASSLPSSVPSISKSTESGLITSLTNLFEQNITLSDKGTSNGLDHIVISGPEQKLVDGIQSAFAPVAKAIPGIGSSYPTKPPTGVPVKDVSADLYIGKDGSLSKVSFDFWQLNPKGKPGQHLPLSLTFNDQATAPIAPVGAVAIPPSLIQSLTQSINSASSGSANGSLTSGSLTS